MQHHSIFVIVAGFVLVANAQAKDLPSQFLPHSVIAEPVLIDTSETVVTANGKKFRQIEFEGQKYLVAYVERDQTHDDEPICMREVTEEIPTATENYVIASETRTAHHRSSFIQGLKLRCQKLTPSATVQAASVFEDGLKLKSRQDTADSSPQEAERKADKKSSQDDKPVFGAPGRKGAGISF